MQLGSNCRAHGKRRINRSPVVQDDPRDHSTVLRIDKSTGRASSSILRAAKPTIGASLGDYGNTGQNGCLSAHKKLSLFNFRSNLLS
jgi:hypothetical protein